MNDQQIIDLYFKRDEQAIAKTKEVYGAFCSRIAKNILNDPEDAEYRPERWRRKCII